MSDGIVAIRARTILPMSDEGPARGAQLFAAMKRIDNALLLVANGRVQEVLAAKNAHLPAGTRVHDVGEVSLIPACVNAHTHVQLSWLAGRTLWGKGMAAWLESMIPQLAEADMERIGPAIDLACDNLAATGTLHFGDVGGSISGTLTRIAQNCAELGLGVSHFCEWLGHVPPHVDENGPWPPRCREEIAANPTLAHDCMPSGHALMTTSGEMLRKAHGWCMKKKGVFSLHLAESLEEDEMLLHGTGPLYDLYTPKLLPEGWRPPGQRPLALVNSLGLLGQGTLAVHGCHLDSQEIDVLAASGTALCLCPRSNRNLAVGTAPVRALMESGTLLCLGTDGLTSNTDLDVRREALFLREQMDVPPEALVRMLTVNGAAALGLGPKAGSLAPGNPARFCILPEGLTY